VHGVADDAHFREAGFETVHDVRPRPNPQGEYHGVRLHGHRLLAFDALEVHAFRGDPHQPVSR
jgi:hypothetical protein